MSKIQVDAIEQQTACGTTLTAGGGAGKTVVVDATTVTLGRCGGTVALASGASQTGFGRTGTVDWITTPKTATFTAVSGEGYFCNTSGGAFTVNLPAGVAGAIVSVADYAATWQTNNLTVSPNGSEKIGSINADVTLSTEGQSVTFVYVDGTQGWINTMDSTSNVRGNQFICASVSGACNTLVTAPCCANTKIATFTGPGDFVVNAAAVCAANNVVSYMVIAGGGGGGTNPAYSDSGRGGGGGAGGFREVKSPVTPYTASPLDGYPSAPNRVTVTATTFPITVGAGAAGGFSSNGSNSIFSTIIATGGGSGGVRNPAFPGAPGAISGTPGGSGGGGGTYSGAGAVGSGNTPPVSPAQGFNGGPGTEGAPEYGAGGGGGAGEVGGTGITSSAGEGGDGVASSISSASVTRAGGGGGAVQDSSTNAGAGGAGGGGAGAGRSGPVVTGVAGTANTGGGGGGAGGTNFGGSGGGTGGSGIVIIRYKFQ